MEHIAYCDAKAGELKNLLNGSKTMLIRGAAGRKLPHGRVNKDEIVYLTENDSSGLIRCKAEVSDTFHSNKLTPEEGAQLIKENMHKLKLTEAQMTRWSQKRYLCLIELKNISAIEPFPFERAKNMDDWIIFESIEEIKKQ